MATPKEKANVGLTLVILFIVTLVTGIILHLKKHGIILEPRSVIKVIHWISGFTMVAFACWHGIQFSKMLTAMRKKFAWFWGDTWLVILFTFLTFITGLIKLVSPVKIHDLGLIHYWFGMIMSVTVMVHLIRGLPGWVRLMKAGTSK